MLSEGLIGACINYIRCRACVVSVAEAERAWRTHSESKATARRAVASRLKGGKGGRHGPRARSDGAVTAGTTRHDSEDYDSAEDSDYSPSESGSSPFDSETSSCASDSESSCESDDSLFGVHFRSEASVSAAPDSRFGCCQILSRLAFCLHDLLSFRQHGIWTSVQCLAGNS